MSIESSTRQCTIPACTRLSLPDGPYCARHKHFPLLPSARRFLEAIDVYPDNNRRVKVSRR